MPSFPRLVEEFLCIPLAFSALLRVPSFYFVTLLDLEITKIMGLLEGEKVNNNNNNNNYYYYY